MNDLEIKKALECCANLNLDCYNCSYNNNKGCVNKLLQDTLDLINRQEEDKSALVEHLKKSRRQLKTANAENETLKAEVERLKKALENQQKISMDRYFEVKELKSAINGFRGYEDKIKAEAYKEFAKEFEDIYTFAVCNARGKCKVVERKNLKWYVENILLKLVGGNNV